jgi:hypothetical protein
LSEVAQSARKLLLDRNVSEALFRGSLGRSCKDLSASERERNRPRDQALDQVPSLLETLPTQLMNLQIAANHSIGVLRLQGRIGDVSPRFTYKVPPKVRMVLCCQGLYATLQQGVHVSLDKLPSLPRRDPEFGRFLDLMWELATGESMAETRDWRRQITAATLKPGMIAKGNAVAYMLAFKDADDLSEKLDRKLHAIRQNQSDRRASK